MVRCSEKPFFKDPVVITRLRSHASTDPQMGKLLFLRRISKALNL